MLKSMFALGLLHRVRGFSFTFCLPFFGWFQLNSVAWPWSNLTAKKLDRGQVFLKNASQGIDKHRLTGILHSSKTEFLTTKLIS